MKKILSLLVVAVTMMFASCDTYLHYDDNNNNNNGNGGGGGNTFTGYPGAISSMSVPNGDDVEVYTFSYDRYGRIDKYVIEGYAYGSGRYSVSRGEGVGFERFMNLNEKRIASKKYAESRANTAKWYYTQTIKIAYTQTTAVVTFVEKNDTYTYKDVVTYALNQAGFISGFLYDDGVGNTSECTFRYDRNGYMKDLLCDKIETDKKGDKILTSSVDEYTWRDGNLEYIEHYVYNDNQKVLTLEDEITSTSLENSLSIDLPMMFVGGVDWADGVEPGLYGSSSDNLIADVFTYDYWDDKQGGYLVDGTYKRCYVTQYDYILDSRGGLTSIDVYYGEGGYNSGAIKTSYDGKIELAYY